MSEQSETVPGARFSATDTPTAIDGVEIAVFEGEAVLFDVHSAMLHRLGAIAGAVWLCCDGSTDVATMIDDLADMFHLDESELSAVVQETLSRFVDEGLIVGHDGRTRPPMAPEPARADDGSEILTGPPDP